MSFDNPAGRMLPLLAAGMLFACAQTPASPLSDAVALPSGGTLRYFARGAQTVVEVIPPGGHAAAGRLTLHRDQTVAPNSPVQLKLLGTVGKQAVIVSDEYDSRPGPMSYCQAGHEEFLRVLTIVPPMKETFRLKLQGCRTTLELLDPGILWKPESSTLEIHWLIGPGPNQHNQSRSYRIDGRGEVKPLDPGAH